MSDTTYADPDVDEEQDLDEATNRHRRQQPRYHVILWNDDDHTHEYVIEMLQRLFRKKQDDAFKLAEHVHETGKAIVLTTTREHAELKRDQIHAYGKDKRIKECAGSMTATIVPAR